MVYRIYCTTSPFWEAYALSRQEAQQIAIEHEADTGHSCEVEEEMDEEVEEWLHESLESITDGVIRDVSLGAAPLSGCAASPSPGIWRARAAGASFNASLPIASKASLFWCSFRETA